MEHLCTLASFLTILIQCAVRRVATASVGLVDDAVALAGGEPHQAVVVVRHAVVAAHGVHFTRAGYTREIK